MADVVKRKAKAKGKRPNPSKWCTIEGEPGSQLYDAMAYLQAQGVDLKATYANDIIKTAKAEGMKLDTKKPKHQYV